MVCLSQEFLSALKAFTSLRFVGNKCDSYDSRTGKGLGSDRYPQQMRPEMGRSEMKSKRHIKGAPGRVDVVAPHKTPGLNPSAGCRNGTASGTAWNLESAAGRLPGRES